MITCPEESLPGRTDTALSQIGISQLQTTIRYIDNQERHHARMSFDEELPRMLEKHGIQPYRGSRD